jgi:hypothetical protein
MAEESKRTTDVRSARQRNVPPSRRVTAIYRSHLRLIIDEPFGLLLPG